MLEQAAFYEGAFGDSLPNLDVSVEIIVAMEDFCSRLSRDCLIEGLLPRPTGVTIGWTTLE